MKKFLKIMALSCVMLLTMNFVMAEEYTDLDKTHWAYPYIEYLTQQGVVVGYPDGTFRPNENVTRAEYASMAIKGLKMEKYQVKEVIEFDDIPLDYWAYDQIQRAAYFELIDAKNKTFDPDGTVTRAHAMSVVVNALTTENLSEAKAREILKNAYLDYYTIEPNYIIFAGKATILNLVIDNPVRKQKLAPDEPATRAELCAFLYRMIEEAKLNPNKKIADAMPKIADGIVIPDATVEGNVATIPAGTLLPLNIVTALSSQDSILGQDVLSKTPDNFITKENYLMLKKGDSVSGRLIDMKKAQWFLRNGELNIEEQKIETHNKQVATFSATADIKNVYTDFWQKLWNSIVKNGKVTVKDGDKIYVRLLKPLVINVGSGEIIE